MKGSTPRKRAVAGVLCAAAVALGVLVPLAVAGGSQPAGSKKAAVATCQATNQPAFPLEMNTVATGILVKTIAMEKEILNCVDAPGGPPVTRDLETFVEVVDKENAGALPFLVAKVFTTTCDKRQLNNGAVTCGKTTFNVPNVAAGPNLADCNPGQQLADPVEMNSVKTDDGKLVKTIKVEKEIFGCNDATELRELYLFTQVIEPVNANGDNFSQTTYRWLGVLCTKKVSIGEIVSCLRFTPPPLQ